MAETVTTMTMTGRLPFSSCVKAATLLQVIQNRLGPAELIAGIITERGVIAPVDRQHVEQVAAK